MLDFFNSAIDNLGDVIFDEDSKSEGLGDFFNGFDEATCDVFKETVC